jgi:DMSO/TMAO reductase YedYZ molybdopterin-dependent catalytic subunit
VSDPDEEVTERAAGAVIVGDGDEPAFSPDALAGMGTVEREFTIACASGDRTTARWTGVRVVDLLDAAEPPPETTHLRLESGDGYRVCLPIGDALDGIVAYARDGELLAETTPYALRFLAPGIDGDRLVKGLRRVEPVELAPGADPADLETVAPDGPGY